MPRKVTPKKAMTAECAREALAYDPETGRLTFKYSAIRSKMWNAKYAGKTAGHKTSNGYVRIEVDGVQCMAHNLAWLITYGSLPEETLDHINRKKNDNRLVNLRPANRSQQIVNTNRRTKFGIRGVTVSETGFHTTMRTPQGNRSVGTFRDVRLAIDAINAAGVALHGEFFPVQEYPDPATIPTLRPLLHTGRKWTDEEVLATARLYRHPHEFKRNANGAYIQARRRGLLKEAQSHMTYLRKRSA